MSTEESAIKQKLMEEEVEEDKGREGDIIKLGHGNIIKALRPEDNQGLCTEGLTYEGSLTNL